ncbi:MAG: disulfide bond formation protein DsbA [Rhodospirillaceae bacterium]|nr:disulfide bond formation protein DsbA [Rhodospirillaceae bacterium]
MKIDIISDTVCPWCFIGKRRLERALAMRPNITAEITWHPFQLNPEMPPDGIERQIYLKAKFGSSERAKDIYRAVDQASVGEKLDLQLDDIKRMPNSLQSHRLLHYARRHDKQDVVAENLFQSYFFYGIDIGSIAHLIKIAAESGLDGEDVRSYMESSEDIELVRGHDLQSRKLGVSGVPCFIIAEEYAISGAQESEVFLQVFDAAKELSC